MKRLTYLGNTHYEFIPSIQNPVLSICWEARILCGRSDSHKVFVFTFVSGKLTNPSMLGFQNQCRMKTPSCRTSRESSPQRLWPWPCALDLKHLTLTFVALDLDLRLLTLTLWPLTLTSWPLMYLNWIVLILHYNHGATIFTRLLSHVC